MLRGTMSFKKVARFHTLKDIIHSHKSSASKKEFSRNVTIIALQIGDHYRQLHCTRKEARTPTAASEADWLMVSVPGYVCSHVNSSSRWLFEAAPGNCTSTTGSRTGNSAGAPPNHSIHETQRSNEDSVLNVVQT